MREDHMTLTPGAIWKKEVKKPGKKPKTFFSTVLFVTNEDRPDEFLEKHPQQVVFLSDDRQVTSMELELFTATRSFHDMDPNMEALCDAIVADPESEDEEIDDLDDLELDDGELPPGTSETTGEVVELIDVAGIDGSAGETKEMSSATRISPFMLSEAHEYADILSSNFVHYEQQLHSLQPGAILHCIKFALDQKLTKAVLVSSFGEEDQDSAASINGFIIRSDDDTTIYTVDGFIDVLTEVNAYGPTVACVYVTSAPPVVAEEQAPSTVTVETVAVGNVNLTGVLVEQAPQLVVTQG